MQIDCIDILHAPGSLHLYSVVGNGAVHINKDTLRTVRRDRVVPRWLTPAGILS